MTFTIHHPSYYKKLKPKQEGILFGKEVTIDISKDLKKQSWFKSDLFDEREKYSLMREWKKTNKIPTKIRMISKEEYYE